MKKYKLLLGIYLATFLVLLFIVPCNVRISGSHYGDITIDYGIRYLPVFQLGDKWMDTVAVKNPATRAPLFAKPNDASNSIGNPAQYTLYNATKNTKLNKELFVIELMALTAIFAYLVFLIAASPPAAGPARKTPEE
jgi:hypothetical protein